MKIKRIELPPNAVCLITFPGPITGLDDLSGPERSFATKPADDQMRFTALGVHGDSQRVNVECQQGSYALDLWVLNGAEQLPTLTLEAY